MCPRRHTSGPFGGLGQLQKYLAPGFFAHEALGPDDSRMAAAPCDGHDPVDGGGAIDHGAAYGELHAVGFAVAVDDEFAAVVFAGIVQEHGDGDVGAHGLAAAHDGVVHVA